MQRRRSVGIPTFFAHGMAKGGSRIVHLPLNVGTCRGSSASAVTHVLNGKWGKLGRRTFRALKLSSPSELLYAFQGLFVSLLVDVYMDLKDSKARVPGGEKCL